jgi:hypothetical protein
LRENVEPHLLNIEYSNPPTRKQLVDRFPEAFFVSRLSDLILRGIASAMLLKDEVRDADKIRTSKSLNSYLER